MLRVFYPSVGCWSWTRNQLDGRIALPLFVVRIALFGLCFVLTGVAGWLGLEGKFLPEQG